MLPLHKPRDRKMRTPHMISMQYVVLRLRTSMSHIGFALVIPQDVLTRTLPASGYSLLAVAGRGTSSMPTGTKLMVL